MSGLNGFLKAAFTLACLIVSVVAIESYRTQERVHAQTNRFDYIYVVSPVYLYKGQQGVLLADMRNGNIWFVGKSKDFETKFEDPVFITRLPLEKLDATPR